MTNKYEGMTKEELEILRNELTNDIISLTKSTEKERGLLKYHATKKLEKVNAELEKGGN
jgi:hypothetical protein